MHAAEEEQAQGEDEGAGRGAIPHAPGAHPVAHGLGCVLPHVVGQGGDGHERGLQCRRRLAPAQVAGGRAARPGPGAARPAQAQRHQRQLQRKGLEAGGRHAAPPLGEADGADGLRGGWRGGGAGTPREGWVEGLQIRRGNWGPGASQAGWRRPAGQPPGTQGQCRAGRLALTRPKASPQRSSLARDALHCSRNDSSPGPASDPSPPSSSLSLPLRGGREGWRRPSAAAGPEPLRRTAGVKGAEQQAGGHRSSKGLGRGSLVLHAACPERLARPKAGIELWLWVPSLRLPSLQTVQDAPRAHLSWCSLSCGLPAG